MTTLPAPDGSLPIAQATAVEALSSLSEVIAASLRGAAILAAQHPALAAVAIVSAVAIHTLGRKLLATWRHRHHAAGARNIAVAPPPEVDPAGAAALWANLAGVLTPSLTRRLLYGAPHVAVEYTWTGRRLSISLWVPGSVPRGSVEAAVQAAWPGATCATAPAVSPLPDRPRAHTGGQLTLTQPAWLPLRTDHDTDPMRPLMSAGAQLGPSEHACVQILARPALGGRARRARRVAGRLRAGKTAVPTLDPGAPVRWLLDALQPSHTHRHRQQPRPPRDPAAERDIRSAAEKAAHPLWETAIRYAVATDNHRSGAGHHDRLRGIAHALAASFAIHTARNQLAHRTRLPKPAAALARRQLTAGFLTSLPELAAIAALPRDLAVPGLERARAKSMPAPPAVPTGGRGTKILGDAEVAGHAVALSGCDSAQRPRRGRVGWPHRDWCGSIAVTEVFGPTWCLSGVS